MSDQYLLDSSNEDNLFHPSHPILGAHGIQGQQVVLVVHQPLPAQHGLEHCRRSPSTSDDVGYDDDEDDDEVDEEEEEEEEDGKAQQAMSVCWRPSAKRPLEDTSDDDEDGQVVCRKRAVPTFRPYRRAFHSSDED